MRNGGKYLEKVQDELNVYQRFMLEDGVELTPVQQLNFKRLLSIRDLLREGYSDASVLKQIRKLEQIQDRRARELLVLAYETFAELRRSKSIDGIKYLEAEVLDEAAREIREEAQRILNVEGRNEKTVLRGEEYEAYVKLMQIWRGVKKDSATIKGAYEKENHASTNRKQKPAKVLFVQINNLEEKLKLDNIIDVDYEE